MRKLVIAAALFGCVGAAHAAENGVYVGAGIVRATVDNIFAPGSNLDISNTSWKGFVGFKFPVIPIGLEADYIDIGSETRTFGFSGTTTPGGTATVHADAKAFTGFAVGYLPLPIPFVDFYGKAGLARWQLNGSTTYPALFSTDDRGTEFAWGAGAQVHVSSFAVRLEFENFNIRNTDGAKLYSLSAAYYFL
jgi:opacity protein-like surface antigen